MAVFTMDQINKRMTSLVQKYLDMGYFIYINAMGSSQSNCIGRVILHNGTDFINIHLDNNCNYNAQAGEFKHLDMDYLALIEESTGYLVPSWNNTGTILSITTFYEIGSKKKTYVDTQEEWVNAMVKHYNRMRANNWGDGWTKRRELKFDAELIIKIVKRRDGYKSCKKSQIKRVVKFHDGWSKFYRIIMEGKKDSIVIPFPMNR